MVDRSNFRDNFNYLIRRSGMTQKEVAAQLGVSQSVISFWCRGVNMPRSSTTKKVATHFGVTVEDLLYGDCKPHTNQVTCRVAAETDPKKMPEAVRSMRASIERYRKKTKEIYAKQYRKADKDIRAAKADFLQYAESEFQHAEKALEDLEYHLRCFLGV